MADVKFIFPNLSSHDLKKYLLDRNKEGRERKKSDTNINKKEKEEKKNLPLFYHHKIRASKYEYF